MSSEKRELVRKLLSAPTAAETRLEYGAQLLASGDAQGELIQIQESLRHVDLPDRNLAEVRMQHLLCRGIRPVVIEASNSLGIRMALLQEGEFQMGATGPDRIAFEWEQPQHIVRISRPFLLGLFPVNQRQYTQLIPDNPSQFQGQDRPVEGVTWFDAIRFCNLLSQQERLTPFYSLGKSNIVENLGGPGYRLPTEAEWEYACRASTTTQYSFGDDPATIKRYAVCTQRTIAYWLFGNGGFLGRTRPCGERLSNPWGLYDLHGNVWEWCHDWYARYPNISRCTDPLGPIDGAERIVRGGAFYNLPEDLRSANRFAWPPEQPCWGFRIVRNLESDSGFEKINFTVR